MVHPWSSGTRVYVTKYEKIQLQYLLHGMSFFSVKYYNFHQLLQVSVATGQ